jgi:hypothetical protein
MTDMVERVAREMAAKEGWRWNDERQMLDCAASGLQNTNRERDTWRKRAIAAIEAMRIPTKSMLEAGVQFHIEDWRDRHQSLEKQWEAAIDAALKENEEKA